MFRWNDSLSGPTRIYAYKPRYFSRPEKGPACRIGNQHFSGTKTLALDNLRIGKIRDADFGADDEQSIRGQRIAEWTQAVAVKLGAYDFSVGKDQRGGAIPGFLLRSAAGEEPAEPWVQMLIVFPSRRHQAQCRLSEAGTTAHQGFESIIETRGIAHPRLQQACIFR